MTTPARHTDLRKAGLFAALAAALLAAAGLAVTVMVRRSGGAGGTAVGTGQKEPKPAVGAGGEIPPDVAQQGLSTGTARVQFADRQDPGRAAGMIEWSKLDPVSAIEKRLTEPRGYVYLRDGGVIVVSATGGTLSTTARQDEPTSGRFTGGVTVKLYPQGTDPKRDEPTLIASSDVLDFDLPSASISAPGAFRVQSAFMDMDGSGLRLVVNQVEEGIERFEVTRVTSLAIRPDSPAPLAGPGIGGSPEARTTPSGPRPVRARTYMATVDGDVELTQDGRRLRAGRVEAWAKLVNNRLLPGSIGRLGPDAAVPGDCPDTVDAGVSPAPAEPTPPGNAPVIRGTWSGPLVVVPVVADAATSRTIPAEFGDDRVALRLHGGDALVEVSDPQLRATASAMTVDYAATSRRLDLVGEGDRAVTLKTLGAGTVTAARASVNLGSGSVRLTGPGTLLPAARGGADRENEQVQRLAFDRQLDLRFGSVRNWIDPVLRTAEITGGFAAASGEVRASADRAVVSFLAPVGQSGRTPVQSVALSGSAVASAPSRARGAAGLRDELSGRSMTLLFRPDPADAEAPDVPTRLEVIGEARAVTHASGPVEGVGDRSAARTLTIKSGRLNADLGRGEGGVLQVASAEAAESVTATDGQGLIATGERLTVDPATGVAWLLAAEGGSGRSTISRDGLVMMGQKVRLTQSSGEVFVDGPGQVTALREAGAGGPGSEAMWALASWSRSMTFRNDAGTALCEGDASAQITLGESERNSTTADSILLTFTPAGGSANRELMTATARGLAGIDGRPPVPATLEHRRFSMINGQERAERIVYLTGPVITADQQRRTLVVPAAGKLLVDDRAVDGGSPAGSAMVPGGFAPSFASAKGTSLFAWGGELLMSLAEGRASLSKDVSLIHQPLGEGAMQTTLDCQKVVATLKPVTGNRMALDHALQRVEALEQVVAKSEGKELSAARLMFDVVGNSMEAEGGGDMPLVTFVDPAKPAPLRARKVVWNQMLKEVRVIEPAPTTVGN